MDVDTQHAAVGLSGEQGSARAGSRLAKLREAFHDALVHSSAMPSYETFRSCFGQGGARRGLAAEPVSGRSTHEGETRDETHRADIAAVFMEALYELYQQLFRMIGVYSETEFEKILLETNAAEMLQAVDDSEASAEARQVRALLHHSAVAHALRLR